MEMDEHFIGYSIVDPSGQGVGTGSCTRVLNPPPRDHGEVLELGDNITSLQHRNGDLPAGYRVNVLSWQRFGG